MLAGGALSRSLAIAACAAPAAALLALRSFGLMRKRSAGSSAGIERRGLPARFLQSLFFIFVVCLIAAVFHDSQQLPLMGDAEQIWGYKAKILYYESLYSPDFRDASQIHQHPNYPLLVPMLESYSYSLMGGVDDVRVKLLFPLFYVCLLMCIYSEARRHIGAVPAAALAAVVATFLPLTYSRGGIGEGSASSGYADVPLTFFYTLAVIIVLRWLSGHGVTNDDDRRSKSMSLVAAGILLAAAVFTKNEGLLIAIIVSLAAVFVVLIGRASVRRRAFLSLLLLPVITLALSAPWLAWRAGLPSIDENYPSLLTAERIQHGLAADAGTILKFAVDRTTPLRLLGKAGPGDLNGWTLFWPILAVACVLFINRLFHKNTLFISLLLTAHIALYFLMLLVTPWDIETLMYFITLRLVMHFSGVAVILLALLMGRNAASPPLHEVADR
jgi:hypothetical protein